MKFIDNWKQVITGAWSVRLVFLSLICLGGYFVTAFDAVALGIDPRIFVVLAAAFQAAAPIARVLVQEEITSAVRSFLANDSGAVGRKRALGLGGSALVIAMATPFIAKWEGVRLEAYRDVVGVPTICFGDTHGVKMGDVASMDECLVRLQNDVKAFYVEIASCMKNPNIPAGVQASLLELAYNTGSGAVCGSTMMRKANGGDYVGACNELRRWVMAGGKRWRGLENRRADSKLKLCMQGLT